MIATGTRGAIKRTWLPSCGESKFDVFGSGGLAEDVSVHAKALDAVAAGFEVCVIAGGTRPVTAEGGTQARRAMETAGIHFTEQSDAGG